MKEATVVGAGGYGGGELVRLLARHPQVTLTQVLGDSFAGKSLASAFPGLHGTGAGALVFEPKSAQIRGEIVFLAQESGYAMGVAEKLLDEGRTVIDLSADFRLRDTDAYRNYYRAEPASADLLSMAVYGLPELVGRESIAGARLIANPGCYVTAASLALAPLVKEWGPQTFIVDAKSGVSGAGRAKSDTFYRYSEMNETLRPYAVGGGHRHTPEIEQNLGGCPVLFTPHLVPMTRGILATCYGKVDATTEQLTATLKSAYDGCPFVIVRESGDFPSTKDVCGSNFCHLSASVDTRTGTVIIVSVIDNLVKGAAGQAVQNMNLALGFPETAGMEGGGLWP
jgi:N-acetyl-gamma-glutamyl-phosphate reductase